MTGTSSANFSSQKDLQRLLDDLTRVAQASQSLEEFFRHLMRIVLSAEGIVGCSYWLMRSGEAHSFCETNLADTYYKDDPEQTLLMQRAMAEAVESGQVVALPPASVAPERNKCPFWLVIHPIAEGTDRRVENTQAIQMTLLRPETPDDVRETLERFLSLIIKRVAPVMKASRVETFAQSIAKLTKMSKLMGELIGELDLERIADAVVNRGLDIVECSRCSLLLRDGRGKLRLAAMSNVAKATGRSIVGRSTEQLGQQSADAAEPVLYRRRAGTREETGTLADFFLHSAAEEVLTTPVVSRDGKNLGVLVVETETLGGISDERRNLAILVAQAASPAIRSAREFAAIPYGKPWRRFIGWWSDPKARHSGFVRWGLVLLAVLVFLLFPFPFSISGFCEIRPKSLLAAISTVEGRIVKVTAVEGRPVKAGEPLASVDDSAAKQQLAISEQEEKRNRAEAERYRSEDERTSAIVSDIQASQAAKESALARLRIDEAVIRSPLDGVVLTRNPGQFLGQFVRPGTQVMEVGDPSKWTLACAIPEDEIGLVERTLADKGEISIRVVLSALPGQAFRALLSSWSQVSQKAALVEGRNSFSTDIPLDIDGKAPDRLRSGYRGKFKLELGYRPLGYILVRRFWNWLQTRVFF